MAKLDKLLEDLSTLTVLELVDLSKRLEDKWGVTAAAPVMAAMPAAANTAAAGGAEEKTEFDVILASAGDNKINVIKAVKDATGLGLKEAKELVDSAPKPIKTGLAKADAEALKAKIEEVGGKVELK